MQNGPVSLIRKVQDRKIFYFKLKPLLSNSSLKFHIRRYGNRFSCGFYGIVNILKAVSGNYSDNRRILGYKSQLSRFLFRLPRYSGRFSEKTACTSEQPHGASISSSVTFTAIPFDSLTALRALSAFLGTPTAIESAIVFSSIGCQGLPV